MAKSLAVGAVVPDMYMDLVDTLLERVLCRHIFQSMRILSS